MPEDEPEGCRWFRLAAEQGYAEAQYDLGLCYDVGGGVPESQEDAFHWYHAAAEQGHAEAQFALAECYEMGRGTNEDEDAALLWYRKAAAQGHEEAITYLEELSEPGVDLEPEIEPEMPEDGTYGMQRVREAHQFGNLAGLRAMPVAAVALGIYGSLDQGRDLGICGGVLLGLMLGYLLGYGAGALLSLCRKKAR